MSDLNQIITVQIDRNTTTTSAVGFGTPLLLGNFPTSIFPERVRTYSSLQGLVDDGFSTSHPVYVAASDLLAQNPSPPEFKVGRRALFPTVTVDLTPDSNTIAAGQPSTLTVGVDSFSAVAGFRQVLTMDTIPTADDDVTFGSVTYVYKAAPAAANEVDIGADAEESLDNLIAAINLSGTEGVEYGAGTGIHPEMEALKFTTTTMEVRHKAGFTDAALATTETFTAGTNVFGGATTEADTVGSLLDWLTEDATANKTGAYTVTDGATKLTVTATTAGEFFAVKASGDGWVHLDVTTDAGVATDLAAIELYDADWYCLVPVDMQGAAEIAATAAWVEAAKKLAVYQTADTKVATLSSAGDTETIAFTLKNSSFDRALLFFHRNTEENIAAAMAGRALPEDAGSITWSYKQLSSVSSQTLTSTERTNLEAKDVNFLSTLAGVAITRYGTVSSGEYADIMRGTDWLAARIQERVYTLLLNNDKLPFTDAGIQAVRGEILAQLQQGVARDFIAASPEPTCTVPLAVDVSAQDKGARTLNDVTFRATLAGAIHKVAIEGELNL